MSTTCIVAGSITETVVGAPVRHVHARRVVLGDVGDLVRGGLAVEVVAVDHWRHAGHGRDRRDRGGRRRRGGGARRPRPVGSSRRCRRHLRHRPPGARRRRRRSAATSGTARSFDTNILTGPTRRRSRDPARQVGRARTSERVASGITSDQRSTIGSPTGAAWDSVGACCTRDVKSGPTPMRSSRTPTSGAGPTACPSSRRPPRRSRRSSPPPASRPRRCSVRCPPARSRSPPSTPRSTR